MKRTIRLLALILTLTLALSAAAMATEIDYEKGETNATKSVSAVSLVEGCTVAFEGEKLKVTYTNSALKEGDMVIVFLLETKDKDGKLVEATRPPRPRRRSSRRPPRTSNTLTRASQKPRLRTARLPSTSIRRITRARLSASSARTRTGR